MKKRVWSIVAVLCCSLGARAQGGSESLPKADTAFNRGYFVVRGTSVNKPEKTETWQLAVTDYIHNRTYDVPVAANGAFERKIPVTDIQDAYLYLGDAVTVFTCPGDTLSVFFDWNEPLETLRVEGTTPERNRELALCLELYRKYRKRGLALSDFRARENVSMTASELEPVKSYYEDRTKAIRVFVAEHGPVPRERKFLEDTYYEVLYQGAANTQWLDPLVYGCGVTSSGDLHESGGRYLPAYRVLRPELFRESAIYRQFLEFFYVYSTTECLNRFLDVTRQEDFSDRMIRQFRCTWGMIAAPLLRDWMIARDLMKGYPYTPFDRMEPLYREFERICETPAFFSELSGVREQYVRFRPGSSAPDFEFPDTAGNTVRLSDFRGKLVYLDFWGTFCGPCIAQFSHLPALHGKYKDYEKEIAYVYVCVDTGGKRWKDAVERHGLQGVNLSGEGWENNPWVKAYGVEGIPQYVLIDREGKIIEYGCAMPSQLLGAGENVLDRALGRQP